MHTDKTVLVICGTGVATSTVVATKVREYLAEHGVPVTIRQGKVADLLNGTVDADLIVATTQVPSRVTTPVVNGVPLLTGIKSSETLSRIHDLLTQ